jgi:ATP synthase protein I
MGFLGPEQRKQLKIASRVGAVGLEMVVATLLGYGSGVWLDEKLGTAPTLELIGLGVGILAGFKGLFDVARKTKL